MTMSKPIVIFSPGSFAPPRLYNDFVEALTAQGVDFRPLHNPTVGAETGEGRPGNPPSMYDDAAAMALVIEKLADAGKKVVLLGHSYGGTPASQAIKGLDVSSRQSQGKPGGIVELAYITCLVPSLGQCAGEVLATVPPAQQPGFASDGKGWYYQKDPVATAKLSMSQMPVEQGAERVRQFAKHSERAFTDKLTYAGYKDVPVSYLLCEQDLTIPKNVQQAGIDMIERESGRKVRVTKIPADHVPMESAREQTLKWIVGLVTEGE